MTDLLISTPEELRAFLPSHTYRNLDTVRGFLVNAQNTFLRNRIGQHLITAMLEKYTEIKPIIPDVPESDTSNADTIDADPWRVLILLAQRCIVYDAFARSADIRALTDNDMGMNVAESDNFDAANDKRVERYKQQLSKEAHSATDMLLLQLEEWEHTAASLSTDPDSLSTDSDSPNPPTSSTTDDLDNDIQLSAQEQAICDIVKLFQLSPTHYLCDGLLFNTATEFQRFVDIYDSRDRFVTLLPDIRYCQELHIESEIGPDLLVYLHDGHRKGTLSKEEEKAYTMLQRTLSLYVEARSKMFNRPDARDEACGYMKLTNKYIADHNIVVPSEETDNESSHDSQPDNSQSEINGYHNPTHHGIIAPPQPSCNGRPHAPSKCGSSSLSSCDDECNDVNASGFLATSLI